VTNPCPGYTVTTVYGKRGAYWSCKPDSDGDGIHTGVDYSCPTGTKVVAARGGTLHHCHHGDAFGSHQVEIRPGDGTRDFYAHLSQRVADGTQVDAGEKIGEAGAEGNATGPHLHFERHNVATGGWSCTVIVDPTPSLNAGNPADADQDWRAVGDVYVERLYHGQQDSDSVARLRYRLTNHAHMPDDKQPGYGADYGEKCQVAVKYWQRNLDPNPGGPDDGTHLNNGQANRLFGDNYTVIEE
jgi:murein DD-endopeptidase MepM/ murein hydrolase activator NlpD